MRKLIAIALVITSAIVAGCGGGSSSANSFSPGSTTGTGSNAVASLSLTTSTPTLPSDGSATATITASARDASNRFLAAVPVTFSTSSGGLTFPTLGPNGVPVTGAAGTVAATLGISDPTNQAITVTATSGSQTAKIVVNVVGTRLSVQGASALVLGQTSTYTIALVDSSNHGIVGRTVTLTSAKGNSLSAASITTDSNGQGSFTVTVSNAGNDTITATALGIAVTQSIAVSADVFNFTTPAANAQINIGASTPITVNWLQNNAPVVGQTVNFATTRGTLSAASATTDANGNATVNVSSGNAGGATLTATSGTSTAQQTVEFIATTPASITLQASSFTVAPAGQSTLTAVVRDAALNLVKNKVVLFSVQDVTGGTLSVASATTDSEGTAQTVYTAGSVTSASNGVTVTATVQGTAVTNHVNLTVAGLQVFIALGTGNQVVILNNATQYEVNYAIQVTDVNGAGVKNVPVTVSLWPVQYYKGYRSVPNGASSWTTTVTAVCGNEDVNHNGILDPGEDLNGNGKLDPGTIALVTPASVTTDATGVANVSVIYPEQYAYYVQVSLTASTSVQGTEFAESQVFVLPGAASDFSNTQVSPPGPLSPYGVATVCTNPN